MTHTEKDIASLTPWEISPSRPKAFVLYRIRANGMPVSELRYSYVFSSLEMAQDFAEALYESVMSWQIDESTDWRWRSPIPNTDHVAVIARVPMNPMPDEIEPEEKA
jgi:hypothetical protein